VGDRDNCFFDNESGTIFSRVAEIPECQQLPEPGAGAGVLASLLTLVALRRRGRPLA